MSLDRMAGSMPVWKSPPPKPDNTLIGKLETVAETNKTYRNERMAGTVPSADLSFSDMVDVMNPLQHIPVVSDMYRKLTGDEIAPAARIVGGTIYGGPIGAASSIANAVVAEHSGKDIGGHVISAFSPSKPAPKPFYRPEPETRMAGIVPVFGGGSPALSNPVVEVQIAMAEEQADVKPASRMRFNS